MGLAFESSGAATMLSGGLVAISGQWPSAVTPGLLMLSVMTLSAAAVLLAPVAKLCFHCG